MQQNNGMKTSKPDYPMWDNILKILEFWGSVAHDENSGFVEKFCPSAWIITNVTWDSDNMRFTYILSCGQHISDSVKMTEWLEFLTNVKKKNEH